MRLKKSFIIGKKYIRDLYNEQRNRQFSVNMNNERAQIVEVEVRNALRQGRHQGLVTS